MNSTIIAILTLAVVLGAVLYIEGVVNLSASYGNHTSSAKLKVNGTVKLLAGTIVALMGTAVVLLLAVL